MLHTKSRRADIRSDFQQQNDRFNELRIELREEVKRWDERFFQSTRDFRSLALPSSLVLRSLLLLG